MDIGRGFKLLSQRAFSETLDVVYQWALEPDLLPEMMEQVRQALDVYNVTFATHQNDGVRDAVVSKTTLGALQAEERLNTTYNNLENNIGLRMIMVTDPGHVSSSEDLMSFEIFKSTSAYQGIYEEVFVPCRIGPTAGITMERSPAFNAGLFYQYEAQEYPSRFPQPAEDMAIARMLGPHLRRALKISMQLGQDTRILSSFEDVLSEQKQGIILLDQAGKVIFMNAKAACLVRDKDGLRIAMDMHLIATHHKKKRQLDLCIAEALKVGKSPHGGHGGELLLDRANGNPPLAVLISPLKLHERLALVRQPAVLIFVSDPAGNIVSNYDRIGRLFRLSAQQVEIVKLLSAGLGGPDIADTLGITRNTLKTQLKRLYAKTDCDNRSEFMALMLSYSSLLV